MKKLKKKNIIILVIFLIILVVGSIIAFKTYEYLNSDLYHLKELGYDEKDIDTILKMDKEYVEKILTLEYDENIIGIFNEKYFILNNLDAYLTYQKENKDSSYSNTIAIINVGADKDWYEKTTKTDMSKEYLILVNKFHSLEEDYTPEDLVNMGLQYAFEGKKIRSEVYAAFKRLVKDAKAEDLTIVANSTFRTYDYQEGLYNRYKNSYGTEYADNYAAKPGHSEHQTGLAIDVSTLNSTLDNFEDTLEFAWLQEHAHEYGFILRYPEDKEHITGYKYESWHYRYVGEEVAKEIKELDITFDEYYAYFIEND